MKKGSKAVKILLLTPPKDEFDRVIKNLLNSLEYKHLNNSFANLLERIKEAIGKWIYRLISDSDIKLSPNFAEGLSMLFLVIGILTIFCIVIYLIVKVYNVFDRRVAVKEILGERIDGRTTPESLRTKAADFAREGVFRQAIRYEFIALLLLMHTKRILYLEENKTNKEIYNSLKKSSFGMSNEFGELADLFNSVWYGHKTCEGAVYDSWKQRVDAVWKEVMGYEAKNR